jgi:type I restriction enzyme S subunit
MIRKWGNINLKSLPVIFIDGDRSSKYPKRTEFKTEGVIFLNANSISNGQFDKSNVNYIAKEKFDTIKKGRILLNDIIMTTRGNGVGDCYYHKVDFGNGLINAQMLILRFDIAEINPQFMYYQFTSDRFKKLIRNFSSGSAQPQLPISSLKAIPALIPPLPTQRKIASILSAYDDLIENNLKRIKLLEEQAQLTYEEWFVRMKFPGHESTPVDKETGLPEGWERKQLGKFTKILKGKNITKNKVREGSVPVVAGGLKPAYYHDTSNTSSPVITVSASGANAGFVNIYLKDVWASDCSFIDSSMSKFLFFIYNTMIHHQLKIFHFQKGSAQPHVYPKDLVRLEVVIPSYNLLVEFNNQAKHIFNFIRLVKNQNQLLKEARDILLPRLMTGMIDVDKINLKPLQPIEEI